MNMLIRPFFKVRKYFKLLEHKHIMYCMEACNLEFTIIWFVSRNMKINNINNNKFREIRKYFCEKFKYVAKQII